VAAALLLLLMMLLAAPGCTTANKFYATNLPQELDAPVVANTQTVDLSNLAMQSTGEELIGPDDVLEVNISAGLSAHDTVLWLVRVDRNGFVQLPDIGGVQLAGMDEQTAENAVKTACMQRQLFRNPHVTVAHKQRPKNHVFVLGAVQKPGRYEIPRRSSDLLAAIVAAGGLAENAGTSVEIRNPGGVEAVPGGGAAPIAGDPSGGLQMIGHALAPASAGPQIVRIDLVSATESPGKGYYVADGGIVVVEKRDPTPIKVLGLVQHPGVFEYPPNQELRVLDALAQAGGVSSMLADKVYVIRKLSPQHEPAVIELSITSAKTDGVSNLRLAPGDTVSVEQTPATIMLDTLRIIRFGIGASLGTLF
jgi:polysaccharide export outer membrane protein